MPSETILVVDDVEQIREFLRQAILEPQGYRVLTARDGISGLKMIHQHRPDLLVMDINMPGKTGSEVLEDLQAAGSSLPVMVISSYGSEDTS